MSWHKWGDKLSPRTGRPIKGTGKRDKKFQIRISADELKLLDECSERLNISRTDTINKGVLLVKQELDKK